jgi:glyoxylase-like metal-dependent hydrolase (beta-lactamase superfamily II)
LNESVEPATRELQVGEIEIIGLVDGTVTLPPSYFEDVDWDRNTDLLAGGHLRLPIGCFLIKTDKHRILVDAGVGHRRLSWARGGRLGHLLDRAAVDPAGIDVVVCTHVHLDHIGGLSQRGVPAFPNAAVRFGAADLRFALDRSRGDPNRRIIEALVRSGRLEPIHEDSSEIVPGITAIFTPGHTPGHTSVVVTSGSAQAVLLGDVVIVPRQIEHPEWINSTDADPVLAAKTRDRLWRWLADRDTAVTAAHFPGLSFGPIESYRGSYRQIGV